MASVIFDSCFEDVFRGAINFEADSFKALLVSAAYRPDKAMHLKRSDVTDEVTGIGYSLGGTDAAVSVSKDRAADLIEVSLGAVDWRVSTITARGAVYYKARDGAASDDELVAFIDFGENVVSVSGTFALSASALQIQN